MKNLGSLFAAYGVAWLVFFGLLISIGARLSRTQDDLRRLKEKLARD